MDQNKLITTVLMTFIAAIFAAILMAWPTQLLWNGCLVPAVDGIHEIGFWQALGINVLFSMLFKASNKVYPPTTK
jgi:hypothetical protein